MHNISLKNAKETIEFAKNMALSLNNKPSLILLEGEIGSGKTTFAKSFIQTINTEIEVVASPTFSLMNIYEGHFIIYHFDLYRLTSLKEIDELGLIEQLTDQNAFRIVEWPEIIIDKITYPYTKITLSKKNNIVEANITSFKS